MAPQPLLTHIGGAGSGAVPGASCTALGSCCGLERQWHFRVCLTWSNTVTVSLQCMLWLCCLSMTTQHPISTCWMVQHSDIQALCWHSLLHPVWTGQLLLCMLDVTMMFAGWHQSQRMDLLKTVRTPLMSFCIVPCFIMLCAQSQRSRLAWQITLSQTGVRHSHKPYADDVWCIEQHY